MTNWYKKAQFTQENTQNVDVPIIMVQPFEPLVQEAVDELQEESPSFFRGINKINLDISYGQFGSVASDNPADININFDNIKFNISNQLGGSFDPNNSNDLREKILYYLEHEEERESIAHNGYIRTMKENTWKHRIIKLLEFINESKV